MKHTLWWETANVSHFTLHCKYRFPSFVAKVRIIIAEYISWQGRYRFYDISNVFERFHLLSGFTLTQNHVSAYPIWFQDPMLKISSATPDTAKITIKTIFIQTILQGNPNAIVHQAIHCLSNAEQFSWCHMVSLNNNELKCNKAHVQLFTT